MKRLKQSVTCLLTESAGEVSYFNDQQQQTAKNISWQDLFLRLTGIGLSVCPVCGNGKMKTQEIINLVGNAFLRRLMLLNRFVCFLTYHGNLAIESP
jgi:hypothetical protein